MSTIEKFYAGDQNGIAREVEKLYIGVDGVARLCWEMPKQGVKWLKYRCSLFPMPIQEFQIIDTGTITFPNEEWYTVYGTVYFEGGSVTMKYSDEMEGAWLEDYWIESPDGDFTYLYLYNPQLNEEETETTYDYDRYDVVDLGTEYEWTVWDGSVTVIATEGEYPDADQGYTYDGEFGYNGLTHIRMKSPDGKYYAYLKG